MSLPNGPDVGPEVVREYLGHHRVDRHLKVEAPASLVDALEETRETLENSWAIARTMQQAINGAADAEVPVSTLPTSIKALVRYNLTVAKNLHDMLLTLKEEVDHEWGDGKTPEEKHRDLVARAFALGKTDERSDEEKRVDVLADVQAIIDQANLVADQCLAPEDATEPNADRQRLQTVYGRMMDAAIGLERTDEEREMDEWLASLNPKRAPEIVTTKIVSMLREIRALRETVAVMEQEALKQKVVEEVDDSLSDHHHWVPPLSERAQRLAAARVAAEMDDTIHLEGSLDKEPPPPKPEWLGVDDTISTDDPEAVQASEWTPADLARHAKEAIDKGITLA